MLFAVIDLHMLVMSSSARGAGLGRTSALAISGSLVLPLLDRTGCSILKRGGTLSTGIFLEGSSRASCVQNWPYLLLQCRWAVMVTALGLSRVQQPSRSMAAMRLLCPCLRCLSDAWTSNVVCCWCCSLRCWQWPRRFFIAGGYGLSALMKLP